MYASRTVGISSFLMSYFGVNGFVAFIMGSRVNQNHGSVCFVLGLSEW